MFTLIPDKIHVAFCRYGIIQQKVLKMRQRNKITKSHTTY